MTRHRRDLPRRVVVLGSGGLIGSATMERLTRDGIAAVGIAAATLDLAADGAGDALADMLTADDAVVFLAAAAHDKKRGIDTMTRNVRIGANVCAALVRRRPVYLVYLSSDGVYPLRDAPITEATCATPTDTYRAMHLVRERMVRDLPDIPSIILRCSQVYGAGDRHLAYGPMRFYDEAARRGSITLFGDGEETRDHVPVDDVADVIRLCLVHRTVGLLNVATGHSPSFAKVAELVADRFQPRPKIVHAPRAAAATYRQFDVSALRAAFPKLRMTAVEDGIPALHRALGRLSPTDGK